MATTPRTSAEREVDYPTSDGRPMAETDVHRQNMMDLILTLQVRHEHDPEVYVSGNLLMFYERGDKRKHVSPDVFLVRGVPKEPPRENYLVWKEGKGPDVVIELTSKTTRREDRKKKLVLYRDILQVPEYFLFDPNADWLDPPLQGYRLSGHQYSPIERVAGHFLPSEVLGLQLVRHGFELRLFDPVVGRLLLTPRERADEAERARQHAEAAQLRAEAVQLRAEAAQLNAETRARLAEAENERLRRELEDLRRHPGEQP
jgi:Uma2 family endonuclease